jgi:hypothetical protein
LVGGISFAADTVAMGIVTEEDYLAIVAEPEAAPGPSEPAEPDGCGGWIPKERAASRATAGS